MCPDFRRHLQTLLDYSSQVTVLRWGPHPPDQPFDLDHVYVEPEARAYEGYSSDAARMDWEPAPGPDDAPTAPRPPQPAPLHSIVSRS